MYGPKIAGNARTSSVPGWAGNCLHVTKETLLDGSAKHRIWLVNHTDPRAPRAIPYLAKHRGEPDMPLYLEDQDGTPPFTACSMKEFYRLEKAQLALLLQADQRKHANAPGVEAVPAEEEVLETKAIPHVPSTGVAESLTPSDAASTPRRRRTAA